MRCQPPDDHDANRVAAAIGSTATGYLYDRSGALLSRVDEGQATSYAYDRYGNQTGAAVAFDSLTLSTYDRGDRLTATTPHGAAAQHVQPPA
jgi:YD repeat-containing protein